MATKAQKLDKLFTKIAQDHLDVETLETRNRDALDFHDVSVASLRHVLELAYHHGARDMANGISNPSKEVTLAMVRAEKAIAALAASL